MNELDARYLKLEIQEYLRRQAIRLRQQGKTFISIGEYLGVHRNTVAQWWKQYEQRGEDALQQDVRGRQKGEGRTLSEQEEIAVQRLLRERFPDEMKIDSALWTRRAVSELIMQECGVKMPIRTVGEYLKRWGFTPQKPLSRAYEQNVKAVENWWKSEYPEIEQRAKLEGASIGWGDESGLRSDAQVGRGYAPVGETPEIHTSQKQRVQVNYIASIDNQGTVRFMLYTQTLTAELFITFLARLIKKRTRKLIWIVDRHPVHRAQAVQQWLLQHRETIEMIYLPPYSPQLNPTEYLNCDVKQGVHSKIPTRNLAQLKQRVLSHLHKLQKLPARIRKYFLHPFITYAA